MKTHSFIAAIVLVACSTVGYTQSNRSTAPGAAPVSADGGPEPFAGLTSHRQLIKGAEVHYRIGGSGPSLLLLHNFMWSGASWKRFADALSKGHTVIIPDLPGHGHSSGMPEVWRARQTAAQMIELLDKLRIGPVRAIGAGAGGLTLLQMGLEQPDRLQAMVLISTPHRLTDEVRQGYRDMSPHEPPEWRDWNRQHNPRGDSQIRAMLAQLRGFGDNYDDFSMPLDRLAGIPTWTLIAIGDRDYAPTLETALELHRTLPHSSLWIIPNAGHCPFWGELPGGSPEAEKGFSAVVLRFFETQSESGAGGVMSSKKRSE